MTTNIIDRLNATLEAKTEAALAGLAGLERQIAETIEQAERAARERIEARLATILQAADDALCGFTERITAHAADAFTRAVDGLAARLDASTITQTAEQAPERTPEPDVIACFEAPHVEQERTTPTVAAHAVESDAVGLLDDPEALEATADVPTTSSPEGLHQREDTGNGRGRYHAVEAPLAGEVYYTRDARRHWNPVRYN